MIGYRLIGALGAILAIAIWQRPEVPALSNTVEPAVRVEPVVLADTTTPAAAGRPNREPIGEATLDPFGSTPQRSSAPVKKPAAQPTAQPAAQPAPPPAPSTPPFPYRVFGRLKDPAGQRVVYLIKDGRLVAVTSNMELDGGYHVESVSESQVVVKHPLLGEPVALRLPEDPK